MQKNRNHREPKSPAEALLFGIFAICFGLFWTIMAGSIFPPMAIFGILWTAIAVVTTVNGYKESKNKEEQKNSSPEYFVEQTKQEYKQPEELRCPYCGAPIHESDKKCQYCDSRL